MYRIYKITFSDGYAYVGMTQHTIEDRIRRHINKPDNAELSRRLTTESYVTEVLYANIPNYDTAIQIEYDEIYALDKPINISGINSNAQIKNFGNKIIKRNTRKQPNRKRERQIPPRPGKYACSICGIIKPHTAFSLDRTRFNGLESRCKQCVSIRSRFRLKSSRQVKEILESIQKANDSGLFVVFSRFCGKTGLKTFDEWLPTREKESS